MWSYNYGIRSVGERVHRIMIHEPNLSIDSSDPRSHLSDQRGLQLEAVPVVHLHVPVVHCQHDLTVVGLKICFLIANTNGVGM